MAKRIVVSMQEKAFELAVNFVNDSKTKSEQRADVIIAMLDAVYQKKSSVLTEPKRPRGRPRKEVPQVEQVEPVVNPLVEQNQKS